MATEQQRIEKGAKMRVHRTRLAAAPIFGAHQRAATQWQRRGEKLFSIGGAPV